MQVVSADMDPIEVLREDLLDRDIEVTLEAVRNIPTVALAIGPEATRDQLIAVIDAVCFPDPHEGYALQLKDGNLGILEEVLREIAFVMNSTMIPLLGGEKHILSMLLLLQKLSMSDETVIREASVDSMIDVAANVDVEYVEQHVLAVIGNLAKTSRWAARTGAAAAAPRVYEYLKTEKNKEICQELVLKLCRDKMPMVRHEACSSVYHMLLPMGEQSIMVLLDFIGPILKKLMNEQQEDFRCHIIPIIKTLLKNGSKELLDVCNEYLGYMFDDTDWRIRQKVLADLMEIVEIAPGFFINNDVLPDFVKCFHDRDTVIRIASIKMAPQFLSHKKIDTRKIKVLLTHQIIKGLVEDANTAVREVVSGVILDILSLIFEMHTNDEEKELVVHVMDKFFFDDSGEVRANFGKGLKKTLLLCGKKNFINRVLPLVSKLLDDPKWRVRAHIFQHITLFAEMVKENNMDEHDFTKILDKALKDPVAEARTYYIAPIPELVNILGPKWIVTKLLQEVRKVLSNPKTKYKFRLVAIHIAETLATSFASDERTYMKELMQTAVSMMLQGTEDPISNVRLTSTNSLVRFIESGGSRLYQSDIRGVLENLNDDEDTNIRSLADKGLSLL